ncbi:MAG: ABC transporter ATP-binding protein [Actinomycetota bacterium]|nr:ABC transporter ATP-binding protein [Actinomycetota bacterium]
MDPLVVLDGVGVSLGGKPVLRDVDLTVTPGETVGISGPNGSGKTTIVRVLATLIKPDQGGAVVLGADLDSSDFYAIRRMIGLIGHVPALIPELSLRENLSHYARLGGIDEDRIDPVLDVVGLDSASDRRASASSFGMKRRVEVAHLLLARPRIVLLDEATSGLDTEARELIDALIDRTTAADGAVVMVSHDAEALASVCSRVLRIGGGRLEPVT